MANGIDITDVKKALFTSPAVRDSNEVTANSLCHKFQIEHEGDDLFKKQQKDIHERRMKKFRKMAKQLEEDDWLYPPIEKLIGLK